MSVLSLDLASRRYRDNGIAVLTGDDSRILATVHPPATLGLEGEPHAERFADRLLELADDVGARGIIIDGPQGWKSSASELEHARVCERKLHTTVRRTLQPWVGEGLILVAEPESDEEQGTFVDLALQLDDGEAMTGALAMHRRAFLATDDWKTIRVLSGRMPESRILRTSQVVRLWADKGACDDEVRSVLKVIESVGNFRPPGDDPEGEWWRTLMRGTF